MKPTVADPVAPASPRLRRGALCVFCGSSFGAQPGYRETAQHFGTLMAEAGFDQVFGGGGLGLMGEVARAVGLGGGKVTGVLPGFLRHLEPPVGFEGEVIITASLSERKSRMMDTARGFAILPGGLGTLDELLDVVTGAQLKTHTKPIVLLNAKDYFAPLLALIDHLIVHGFAHPMIRDLIQVAETAEAAVAHLTARIRPAPA